MEQKFFRETDTIEKIGEECIAVFENMANTFELELAQFYLKEFFDNTRHYHISDHSTASDCMLPGNGCFDFKSFFDFLKEKKFNGSSIIEVYSNSYKNYSEIKNSHKNLSKFL